MQFEKQYKQLYQIILQQTPSKSDLIVWLQGDRFDRAQKVFFLYQDNFAKKILITGNNKLVGKQTRPGENNVTLNEMEEWLKKQGVKPDDIIIDDSSMNTKEQAKFTINFAKQNGYNRLLLVGSSYYQPRAFLTFLKEATDQSFDGVVINQAVTITDDKIPGGRGKTAGELRKEEIFKIKKYCSDVASVNEGIKYLSQNL